MSSAHTLTVEGITFDAALLKRHNMRVIAAFDGGGDKYINIELPSATGDRITIYPRDGHCAENAVQLALWVLAQKARVQRLRHCVEDRLERAYREIEDHPVMPCDFQVGDVLVAPRTFSPATVTQRVKRVVVRMLYSDQDYPLAKNDLNEAWYRADDASIKRLRLLSAQLWRLHRVRPGNLTLIFKAPYIQEG